MTLTEFLLARIAEDEETARRATQGPWKLWGMQVLAARGGTSDLDAAVPVAHTSSEGPKPRTFNATHIARHDPARVLAECAAKRAIVKYVGTAHQNPPDPYDDAPKVMADLLELIALPYADHPDYDEAWRP